MQSRLLAFLVSRDSNISRTSSSVHKNSSGHRSRLMLSNIPGAWKVSFVVPVPKGSDSTSVSNHRPISLLSVVSKLLERHMHYLIFHHIETFFPIASNHWGFQPRKSTVSAHHWSLALDQRKEVAAVFFDLRKAFDSVPHRPLLDKLTSIGLSVAIPYQMDYFAVTSTTGNSMLF